MEPVAFILITNSKHVELVGTTNTKLVELQLKYVKKKIEKAQPKLENYKTKNKVIENKLGT